MNKNYRSIRRVSESQSEASSIATEISENDVKARLGIPDSSQLAVERFKVDRKKLEEMIQSEFFCATTDQFKKKTIFNQKSLSRYKSD